jgi:hypothetical protein
MRRTLAAKRRRAVIVVLGLIGGGLVACGPSGGTVTGDGGGAWDASPPVEGGLDPLLDSDGDTIADRDEGVATLRDTDGDGTPDYLDVDSDGDGIPDALEAGDGDVATPPVDTDGDGLADYLDNDSDNDGLPDGVEDANHNGQLDPGETDPTSQDTDGDGVSDLVESVAGTDPRDPADTPQARGNLVFLEPYQAPPAPPSDHLRFRTSIAKVDLYFLEDVSVSMQQELAAIHDNVVAMLEDLTCDPGESAAGCPADCPASCGDGTCDPGESPATCPYDCLGTCGDGVCVGSEAPATCAADCPATCGDGTCAAGETPLTCPSDCAGTCGDGICHAGEQPAVTSCVPNIHSGVGVFGTASNGAVCSGGGSCAAGETGNFVYRNLLDIQADSHATETALPDQCWGSACWEPHLAATFYTVSGMGSAQATAAGNLMPPLPVPAPPGCPAGYRGYPCFRPDSLPIILLISDEPFSQCYLPDGETLGTCATAPSTAMTLPQFPKVASAVNTLGAKIIGVLGANAGAALTADMRALGTQTGSVNGSGEPYVYPGADADAAPVIAAGIRELTATLPLDMSARYEDDPGDAVDTFAAFVASLETFDPGTGDCMAWPAQADRDGDSYPDTYLDVTPGLPVCWQITVKQNTTVPATSQTQIFRAHVTVWGNNTALLDTRTVYFVVPPAVSLPQ